MIFYGIIHWSHANRIIWQISHFTWKVLIIHKRHLCLSWGDTFEIKSYKEIKSKRVEKIYHANNHKWAEEAILILK